MRLPNGYGGVVKLSGKRRKPFAARVTAGWKLNERTGKAVQQYQILGYSETKAGALQILAKYNDNPIDLSVMKLTFEDIYTRFLSRRTAIRSLSASFRRCPQPLLSPVRCSYAGKPLTATMSCRPPPACPAVFLSPFSSLSCSFSFLLCFETILLSFLTLIFGLM